MYLKKKTEMEEFIEHSISIISVLGVKDFDKLTTKLEASNTPTTPIKNYEFVYQGKFKAKSMLTNEGFILLKGSEINPKVSSKVGNSTIKNRQMYADKIDDNFITTDDLKFSSPSGA